MQGVHPHDAKDFTNKKSVENLPVCEGDEFFVSLTQHIGAPAIPLVKKGDEVKAGQLIAEAEGFISANIHSPVDGVVAEIGRCDYPVTTKAPCISIKACEQSNDYVKISEDIVDIADIAKVAGIVGMGGAMFPSHVKLMPPHQLDTLIINGVECEPYLTCDHRLMIERAQDLVSGAILIKNALKLKNIVIGIEANKSDAADIVRSTAQGLIEVCILPLLYPQGGEKQLIQSVTGKEIPEGKLPSELNIIVHNVSTVLAVYDAVTYRKPLISRVVTVSGCVKTPKNLLVPIGTPVERLVEFCGGVEDTYRPKNSDGTYKVIFGGPMTGFAAHSLKIPSYKGMNGVLVMHGIEDPETVPCIRCGRCIRACPSRLSPVTLEQLARERMFLELYEWRLLNCIECSACNYICPSRRPLKTFFRLFKREADMAGTLEQAAGAKNG